MSKFFESSEYVAEMATNEFANASLEAYGLNLKVISTTKAKDVLAVAKASATTEFLTKEESIITLICYEQAFEMLDEETQKILLEGAISSISYDSEKDKINIDKSEASMLHRMRHKYGNDVLDKFEAGTLAIQQIAEQEAEEKERKRQEKMEKKQNRGFE